jgi:hypothetical protein
MPSSSLVSRSTSSAVRPATLSSINGTSALLSARGNPRIRGRAAAVWRWANPRQIGCSRAETDVGGANARPCRDPILPGGPHELSFRDDAAERCETEMTAAEQPRKPYFVIQTSTRRFFAVPASVSLHATGAI